MYIKYSNIINLENSNPFKNNFITNWVKCFGFCIKDYFICKAIDYNEKTLKTVEVNAGTFGQITFFLCTKCIDKFKNQAHVKNLDYQINSQPKQNYGDLS